MDEEVRLHGGAVERAEELRVERGAVGVDFEGGGVEEVDLVDGWNASGDLWAEGCNHILQAAEVLLYLRGRSGAQAGCVIGLDLHGEGGRSV